MNKKKIHLTAGEIAALWTEYMTNSMVKCMTAFMLKHIEDPDIKPVVKFAYKMSTNHLEQLLTIFEKEHFAVPNGFTDQDVNLEAPRLFSDTFCLSYVNHLAAVGMVTYSGAITMCDREDIRDFFTLALTKTAELYNQSKAISLSKGIHAKHPYMEVPREIPYVDSKKYMSGLNPFNEKRPLNAVEISNLHLNTITNDIGSKLCISFAQTSLTKEVQEFMLRGKDISKKHLKIFSNILLKNDLEAPRISDITISDSTTKTFSDKLMMFHMSLLMSAGIGNYATAGSASLRSDLMLNYERFSIEVAGLAKSGADIMIKHHWLEQPPGAINRDSLVHNKEKS